MLKLTPRASGVPLYAAADVGLRERRGEGVDEIDVSHTSFEV